MPGGDLSLEVEPRHAFGAWCGVVPLIVGSSMVLTACAGEHLLERESDTDDVLGAASDSELSAHDAEWVDEDPDFELGAVDPVVEPYDLYDPDRLLVFKFVIEPTAMEQLALQPREYVPAELELVQPDSSERMRVGFRLKGEGSFRTLDGKAALRIKLDEYERGQRLHGRRTLTLNNMMQDGTLMAERLAYEVFREMGAPASRANHAMVYVNDEYYGLYANIETPNEEFLAEWFEDPDRTLYEEAGRDFDRAKTAERFERETNERQADDRENLRALEQACIASELDRVRELVDWPKFLLFSALEATVNQVDGYSYAQSGPNNYRIYDSGHGLVFIPWGLDWAFGPVATQDGGLFVDPFWVRPKHGVLMRMCLADSECRQEYREVVALVAVRWDGMKLEEKMDLWAEQTRVASESDERRESTYESVLADRENTRQFIRGRAQALFDALDAG